MLIRWSKCKYIEKTFFHDSLHCHLDFLHSAAYNEKYKRRFAGLPAFGRFYGQEDTKMMWILLAALVGVVSLSVKEQLDRERDSHYMRQLAREYSY